jgi:type II secretory pathway pseudopilin PulG
MNRRPTSGGYTLLEIVIVASLALTGLTVLASVVGGTKNLSEDTRTHTRAESEHRRNLQALADLLRSADAMTLDGFDTEAVARTPTFQRVVGIDANDRTYGGLERLEWRATTDRVWGVERPGEVVWISAGGTEVLARNVPEEGFSVRQEGGALAIRLTTYYSLGVQRTIRVTGETAVSLRN